MRFFGKVWFEDTVETTPGVWEATLIPKEYIGDVNRYVSRWEKQEDSINDHLNLQNEFSIVADSYMLENLGSMRCVEHLGVKWKISSVTVQYPRVILSVSNVYNMENEGVENEEG